MRIPDLDSRIPFPKVARVTPRDERALGESVLDISSTATPSDYALRYLRQLGKSHLRIFLILALDRIIVCKRLVPVVLLGKCVTKSR
jgi:hypothetical protein